MGTERLLLLMGMGAGEAPLSPLRMHMTEHSFPLLGVLQLSWLQPPRPAQHPIMTAYSIQQWLSWLTQILLQVSTAMEIYVQQQARPAQGHPCTTTTLPQAGFLAAVTAPILAATCPAPA